MVDEAAVLRLGIDTAVRAARGADVGTGLADEAARLFGSDEGAYVSRLVPECGVDEIWCSSSGPGLPAGYWDPVTQRVLVQHPGLERATAAGTTAPVRVSDVVPLGEFWTTEVYDVVHGWADGRYPMAAVLGQGPRQLTVLALHRRARDYSDAERDALALLQRVVAPALLHRAELDAAVQRLRALDPAAPVRPTSPGGLCLDYRPTPRQAEVLALLARGWTDRQVGRSLGISERTVRKHLSAVYEQAGVRGRAAAAAWWQQRSAL